MRTELARRIAHVRTPGEHATAIPGLTLYRLTAPTACYAAEYETGLAVIVQGRKRVTLYARGEAYLAAKQGAEAAAEFQKILDDRGIVVSDPIGALARLQLARAFALSGDNTRAKAAYQDFLSLWKDADPDILILHQAKAEYTNLKP